MVDMAFIHGLRVSELTALKVDDYDPLSKKIYIKRLKGGLSTSQPLLPEENIVLLKWIEERKIFPGNNLSWLFLSHQGKNVKAAVLSTNKSLRTISWFIGKCSSAYVKACMWLCSG
ncbi:tyrosine-type recombinase/integrase [Kosakonia oryziphila]|uniref:tyrosine-type recombinase/integrase n=1 Tax=Kosakonia oryziphila TaxID=1005667 RepID=UPI001FC91C0F|nr:tyrosine-type recombinase/integrase [Kosakonia oryziphila]